MSCWEAGLGIMRTVELSLPLACCSTKESGPGPRLGSTVEQVLDVGVANEPVQKGVSAGELSLPLLCCTVVWMRERDVLFPSLVLTIYGSWPLGSRE